MEKEKTITHFLDNDYKEYATYVIEDRAIPSVIDGFKPTQRKIIFISNKVWKTGNEKPLKIFQLAGKVASDAHYHHGDGSLNFAIISMAQSFKNSMPVLEEIGQFGSLRSPEAGAPRYISTKLHSNFRLLYKDFELLTPRYEEGMEIEPNFFLPIIPTVLLNGGAGIAVGFSTNILNRNPLDLIDACLKYLDGKSFKEPIPWYKDFKGECIKDPNSNNSWIFKGSFSIKNQNSIEITELPPSMTYEKFDSYLMSLEEENKIISYENNCKSNVNYIIKIKKDYLQYLINTSKISRFLKIEEKHSENFIVLDENKKLKIFNSASEIIKYFVDFRLKYYEIRKKYLLNKLNEDLKLHFNKLKFIELIIKNKIKITNILKNDLISLLNSNNLDKINDSYDYLLNMPINSLTKEKYDELLLNVEKIKNDMYIIQNKSHIDMYKEDLNLLKKVLNKNIKK